MRITSKGQVTIPADNRERAGLRPNTEDDFAFDGTVVRIAKAKLGGREGRGARLVDETSLTLAASRAPGSHAGPRRGNGRFLAGARSR